MNDTFEEVIEPVLEAMRDETMSYPGLGFRAESDRQNREFLKIRFPQGANTMDPEEFRDSLDDVEYEDSALQSQYHRARDKRRLLTEQLFETVNRRHVNLSFSIFRERSNSYIFTELQRKFFIGIIQEMRKDYVGWAYIKQKAKNEEFYSKAKLETIYFKVLGREIRADLTFLTVISATFMLALLVNVNPITAKSWVTENSNFIAYIIFGTSFVFGILFSWRARFRIQKLLESENQPETFERNETMLPSAIERRDKARRNANFIALMTILAAFYPAVITNIEYIKNIESDGFNIVVFGIVLALNIYNLIMTKIISKDVYLYSGMLEPAGVVKYKIAWPFEDLHDFVIRFLPEAMIMVGFACALGRFAIEIFEAVI